MSKEKVLELLVKNLKRAVPEFADEGFDTSKSYQELGVSSLELVEVVTRTTKELKLSVPFQELAKVRTTDDLADVIAGLMP
ncbi:MAG: phosphopantetheine-binding protein [Desulfovibrionaceae bacterium]